jgi:hypothetical protein
MPAIKASSTSEITALVSGTPEKARRLASQDGVPESSIYSYEQFDLIRENAYLVVRRGTVTLGNESPLRVEGELTLPSV